MRLQIFLLPLLYSWLPYRLSGDCPGLRRTIVFRNYCRHGRGYRDWFTQRFIISISGPAAGLTAIVAIAIGKMPAYEAFLLSVVIAGVLQVILGFLRAGIIGDYIPNSVIRGMLASIGLVLILKQFPHLIGYENDYTGDETFFQIDSNNTFSELINSVNDITPFALIIGILSILILLIWDRPVFKKKKFFKNLPGPLL